MLQVVAVFLTLMFHKVVRRHIWTVVVCFIAC